MPEHVRFTRKGDMLYGILLHWPEDNRAKLPLLGLETLGKTVDRVEMIGADAPLTFTQDAESVVIELPKKKPGQHAWTLRIHVPGVL